ncbi:hypothetical protein B8X02_14905 [Stenotrophomonas rhizophila]|uniref:NACHT domain-containing protein n=1 Tax=Stenotrophomonas rhizophila TaxID=216778 RepID=UPI000BA73EC0|nr:NACHT domain-containing protein [Stenotrophomonas rhizophila]PAK90826.1 hypothetical protein B8X02_14905 [Stenotrophomonas rhizophila]UQY89504.1 NACHT domain-containing protein [Stenotrophomonas rhizophila]
MTDNKNKTSALPALAIDKTRASKAGHAYHEAWAARSALELLMPSTDLSAITLEGFNEADESDLGTDATEIADMVRYFGGREVATASRVEVVQFKYSIASASVPLRAADLAKTLRKFADTDTQLRARHGDDLVRRVVRYELATNRPVNPNLVVALKAMINGEIPDGDVEKQVEQIARALAQYAFPHPQLLSRLSLSGNGGSLRQADHAVSRILASWSEASDPASEKRLLKLRNLVRIKAGGDPQNRDNQIDRVAILAELEVDHEDRLYPTPDAFPETAHLIERPIIGEVVALARSGGAPLIVHGAGGMGKTVLMQSLAERMRARDQVAIFDGFGAGRWRDLADGRYRPDRTLVHIANLLAGRGLCDILLPISDLTSLLRGFRQRLSQAVGAVRQAHPEASVVLLLDAIDHAAISAAESGTRSFAHVLLNSLSVEPIDGVIVVASCRTERLKQAVGNAEHRNFEVAPFTSEEAEMLIVARDASASAAEIAALLMRSGRNPRCLDMLLVEGRPYDPVSPPNAGAADVLDGLLERRLGNARRVAISKGATNADVDLLLTGLALLPPPVPLSELAAAHTVSVPQVESFAADLAPLLERTAHGLMFRDEPTETLIRRLSSDDASNRERVVATLVARQSDSDYAARALPALLTTLKRVDQLVELAFDSRVPGGASKISQRDIRRSRITAALEACARGGRRDDLFRLMLEAAIVVAGHERSDRFLYEFPDLAAVAGDAEALRRLFSTKAGWPGGRHSALAIANSLIGEVGEARRNARRAIDWYNWAAANGKNSRFERSGTSDRWDDVGFGYVEMLAGNDQRVTEFFARSQAGYGKFHDLFDLFERHSRSAKPPSYDLERRLLRCRSRSIALWAAALRFSRRDPSFDRRLVGRLAAAEAGSGKSKAPVAAILAGAARAIDLGMAAEARTILGAAAAPAPSLYTYTSQWIDDREADTAVFSAGVKAAVAGRQVTLLDLAPTELLSLVSPSVRARGPAAFTKALENKLTDAHRSGTVPRRRRKPALDYERRTEYQRALSERIKPLMPYAQVVTDTLRPPPGLDGRGVLDAALDRLQVNVEQTSNYPYRDGKAYLARTGFQVLFRVADAIGAIDRSFGNRIVSWLENAPGMLIPQLTAVVARLSRVEECHDAALRLAGHVENLILRDTDIGSRITAYGALSRAVWRVSTDESSVLFRRTLDLADAIGSDDFDRTNHLLELVAHHPGPELSASAGHDLARILELNLSEDSRYPWLEYANAMVPVAGLGTLAISARLDDRDIADLGFSLGPALATLVKSEKLSADLACCLFGLAAPRESWFWRIDHFVQAVIGKLESEEQEWLFGRVLVEVDRSHQLSPYGETIRGLLVLARDHLPESSAALARIVALAEQRGAENSSEMLAPESRTPRAYDVDLSDPDAIDRAILAEETVSSRRRPRRTIADLALGATTPGKRLGFVGAVVNADAASLSDKLYALEDYLPEWVKLSPALKEALPGYALILAAKHAQELIVSRSEAWAGWRDLDVYFGAERPALVETVVTSVSRHADGISGDAWLALAAKLARSAGGGAMAEGLERFLALSGATLPVEVGDGPWGPAFAVSGDDVEVAAQLIWARLGHSKAAMRWRAAHSVLRLGEVGRFDVIDRIVAQYDSLGVLPFSDAKLPFYPMHARLWLLIALARLAMDHPNRLVQHQALLERIAFSTEFPHAAMQAFAIDALRALCGQLDSTSRDSLRQRLDSAGRSPFPHQPVTHAARSARHAPRPEQIERSDEGFFLDYDFNKYQTERLCRVFGCTEWEVENGISKWVRRWDRNVRGMFDCPRGGRDDESSWSSGSPPEVDRYGGYLAWHALMLVAGEMLQTRIVLDDEWYGDAWSHFLAECRLSRPDGRWLAEATDLFPLDLTIENSLPMPDSDTKGREREDHELLAPILGIHGGKIVTDWLPVAGRWSLPQGSTLMLTTLLATPNDAWAALMTLLTEVPFFRWLPNDGDEIDRYFGKGGHSVRAWIDVVKHAERKLDDHDPYAATTAMERPAPATWVCELLNLRAEDPFMRRWCRKGEPIFQTEAWGATGGRGEHRWETTGERIVVATNQLSALLETTDRVLVGALKVQRYNKDRSSSRPGDTSSFTHRTYAFIVDQHGHVLAPLRASRRAQKVVSELDSRSGREFRDRFIAISTDL